MIFVLGHLQAPRTAFGAFVARVGSRRWRCLAQGRMYGRSALSACLKRKWSLLVAAEGMLAVMGGMGRSVGAIDKA